MLEELASLVQLGCVDPQELQLHNMDVHPKQTWLRVQGSLRLKEFAYR